MFDTILLPTDGSDHAVQAAEHGRYLAQVFDASVHVLHVVDVQVAGGVFDAAGVDETFVDRLEDEGWNAIDAVETVVRDLDDVTSTVLRGEPSETILSYVDDHDADLVAMGTHGRTGIQRYVLGSVTERVVRRAPVPVLTIRSTASDTVPTEYDEILVPTDGSESADAAVEHALAVAERTDARVHAVTVVDIGAISASPSFTPPSAVLEQLRSSGAEATESIAARVRDRGLDAVTDVLDGVPSERLLEYVDDNEVDLVTMATTGQTGLNRYLLGSTTERIVRHAPVPVLAVNARDGRDGPNDRPVGE